MLTEHDSVLNTRWILDHFDRSFTHPASRVIWYGAPQAEVANAPRILVKTDVLPQDRISQFSHMSVLFSPQNPLYGRKGSVVLCANGQPEAAARRCPGRRRSVVFRLGAGRAGQNSRPADSESVV